jgi:hypothetical protein
MSLAAITNTLYRVQRTFRDGTSPINAYRTWWLPIRYESAEFDCEARKHIRKHTDCVVAEHPESLTYRCRGGTILTLRVWEGES